MDMTRCVSFSLLDSKRKRTRFFISSSTQSSAFASQPSPKKNSPIINPCPRRRRWPEKKMEAAIGAATGLVGSVLNLLSNELVEAYVASTQLGLNYDKIRDDLMLAQGLLHEAQTRGVSNNPGLEGLLQKLTVKADEAEDVLDELHYFIIQDQLDGTHYAVPDLGDDLRGHARHGRHALLHAVGNCLACFSCSSYMQDDGDDRAAAAAIARSTHYAGKNDSRANDDPVDKLTFDRVAMSKKIKFVIEELHSLCDPVSKLLCITPHHSTTATLNTRQRVTGSTITQDTLYGRRAIFEKTIVDILTTATDQGQILSVLPIVGPGGIGKTTFAQHLYNDERIQEHFAIRVWVCVSTDFDELSLSQQILCRIEGSNSPNQTTSLDQLQISIAEKLKSKRVLIVLDDIWKCNNQGWENLLAPLRKGQTKGNMVLVTTRFPSIVEMVKTTDPVPLKGLEPDEFFSFFQAFIFDGENPEYHQEYFDDLAKDIANRLKGSPLAAKTVGRLLRKKFSREHWMGVLENNEWQKQKNNDDIMPSLRISYDYLPFHLKKCFSYFSLFPEDFKFRNLDITYFWIALGIIEKDENYMEELVNSGFLMKKVDYSEQEYYVMHDLLHELSRSVSSRECLNICSSSFRVDNIPQTVRHLSITMEDRFEGTFREDMFNLRSKIDIRNLRALMIFKKYDETIDGVLKDIFKDIQGLRVVWIVSPKSLPTNYSKLIHLRYLKIYLPFSYIEFQMNLHSTLSRFYHLKFLDLYVSYKLPKDISRLTNLCHFGVGKEIQSNVPGVGKMKCLRELKKFCVRKESVGFELRELGELTELGGELSIHNLEKVATKEDAAEAKLVCKRYLKELKLVWGTNHQHSAESDILDALQPHHNLGALSIINHGGITAPSWLCDDISIKMLRSLHLEGVSWRTLPPFGQLLHLTSLTLISISALREIRPDFGGATDKSFVHLKQIVLLSLPEFIEWVGGDNAHSFSRLESILCKDCPNLRAVPFLECSVSYTNLSSFSIVDCPKLSLPPMPHTSTLISCHVRLGSTELSYSYGDMKIDRYGGKLSLHKFHKAKTMTITAVSHISLTELNKLKSLIRLDISRCNVMCHGLQDIMSLQWLRILNCGNFFQWPIQAAHTIKPFPASLRRLEIQGESSMESMALLSNLTCLASLRLVDCENLTADGFNPIITVNLDSLVVCNSRDCLSRSISADLLSELVVARTNLLLPAGTFHKLERLEVDCISAVLVDPICSLLSATLQTLKFRFDQRADSFTEKENRALQLLTSLRFIDFLDCPNLPSLPRGLHNLPSLWQLRVLYCPQIRSLPKGGFPTSMGDVTILGCSPELKEQVKKSKETNPELRVTIC